jgi:hypothetical protein
MDGWMGGWVGGWVGVKAVLRIAYSNQKVTHKKSNLERGLAVVGWLELKKIMDCSWCSTKNQSVLLCTKILHHKNFTTV